MNPLLSRITVEAGKCGGRPCVRGYCRTPTLLATMERAWPDMVQQFDAGARLIEVL